RELEGMRRTLTRTAFAPSNWPGASPTLTDVYALLTSADVAPDIAREIAQQVEARMMPAKTARVMPFMRARESAETSGAATSIENIIADELRSRFRVEPHLGRGE